MPPFELLDRALAALRANDPRSAEELLREAVRRSPTSGEAWLLLGTALRQRGQDAEAVDAFRRATQLRPDDAQSHLGLGRSLAVQGRRGEAADCLRRALSLQPDAAEILVALGVTLAEGGQLAEAIPLLEAATRTTPLHAPAFQNLGVALAQAGRLTSAAQALEEALRLEPGYAEAAVNLGNVLRDLGRKDDAIARYRTALELRPGHGEAYLNLGLTLSESGRAEEAVVILQQAVRLRPASKDAHNNLGLALAELGRFAEAEASYQEALRLDPAFAAAHGNLGNAYKEQGRFGEALACYDVALWHEPGAASVQYNRALTWLHRGDYARGWPAYEWRWRRNQEKERHTDKPRWDGSALAGKTILLWCEQGLGDTLQFVRYAALVQGKGGRVVLECPPQLTMLLSTCVGVDQVVAEGEALPAFDVQAPLLSLPGLFGTTPEAVPAGRPYLAAESERVEAWRGRLATVPGFRVGICWQGNRFNSWDRHRSLPLRCFAPLAAVEGVRLVSLQKGPGAVQIGTVPFGVVDFGDELDPPPGGFRDAAAVLRHLDLVVSCDSAVAHLAGALGVPVWLALSTLSDWRWLRDREETPWYPGTRLYRQERLGDWRGVFARMAEDLRERVAGGAGRTTRIAVSAGELLDRVGILAIKAARIRDVGKRARVQEEGAALASARTAVLTQGGAEVVRLDTELKAVNEQLWDVEEALRSCEWGGDFGSRFVELARSVYRLNDQRAELKRQVNGLVDSVLDEAKEYGPER